jgi:phosphatidylglycerol---prolipoprotein diacylglyceryl transferase
MIINYPYIDPVVISLGSLQIHWYALMYLFGFFSAWYLARYRIKTFGLNWTPDQLADLIFYSAIGVILGGRIGYMLFYDFSSWMHHPAQILKIWQGGMSFHGGFLGVLTSLLIFGRKYKLTFFELTDFIAPLVPIGLAAGRLGNFINGELVGRPTYIDNWGMVFPYIDMQPRHPSQLYECLLEGMVLFLILWLYTSKPRPRSATSGLFLLFYGIFRFILEFFREPDVQLGFLWDNWLTMGQLLSFPMIIGGVTLLILAYRKENARLS